MEMNPYAAPESQILTPQATSAAEEVRRAHLSTESSIKTVGILYYLSSAALVAVGITDLVNGSLSSSNDLLIPAPVLLALGIGIGLVGRGLRTLKAWARIPTIILACIGLLGFPLGTVINVLILINVGGKKGLTVMTPGYREVIAATPHVKHKTSKVTWVLLILLLIVLFLIILAAMN